MKRRWLLISVASLLLGLAACELGDSARATPIPTLAGRPPQSDAAEIRPAEQREALTLLSSLLDYDVVGVEESAVGRVVEFIINTCETYIIYFLVDPHRNLDVSQGHQVVGPFEAVTINSGRLDAENETIGLHLAPAQVAAAPAYRAPLPLYPLTWEEEVRAHWQDVARIGILHSECAGEGGTVHKIAYARQLLGAELKDANQNVLGQVEEAILEPETGRLLFYVVQLRQDSSLVLVPLGRTNIPEAALEPEPGNRVELVLLTENEQVLTAPRINSLDQASQSAAHSAARQHWGQ
jgi:sporulation protein YlmC with PRC-barrel domain